MSTVTAALFWFPLAWITFWHPFTLSLYVFLNLKWISCKQYMVWPCVFCFVFFTPSQYILIEELSLLTCSNYSQVMNYYDLIILWFYLYVISCFISYKLLTFLNDMPWFSSFYFLSIIFLHHFHYVYKKKHTNAKSVSILIAI